MLSISSAWSVKSGTDTPLGIIHTLEYFVSWRYIEKVIIRKHTKYSYLDNVNLWHWMIWQIPTLKLDYLIINTIYSKCWKGSDGPTSCEVKSSLPGTPSKQVLQLLFSTFWTILNLTCSLFSFISCPSGHGFSGERLAKPRQLFVLMLFGFEVTNTFILVKDIVPLLREHIQLNLSRTECLLLQVDLLEIALREQQDLVEKIFLVEATVNHRGVHLMMIISLSSSALFNHHHHCIGGISQSSQSQSQSSPLSLSLPLPITESDRNYDFYSSIQSHWFGSGCNSLNGSVLKS